MGDVRAIATSPAGSLSIQTEILDTSGRMKSHLLVVIATLLVAGSFLATDKVSSVSNPMSLTLLRFAGGVLVLAPYVLRKVEYRRQMLELMPRGLIMGFFYAAFFVCFFQSLKETTALNTGSIYTLAPFVTALLSLALLGHRIQRKNLTGYTLGIGGTLWVIFQGDLGMLRTFSFNSGDLIFTIGVLLMCCFSVSMKLMSCRRCNPFVLVFCVLFGGGVWMALALLCFNQPLGWHLIALDAYVFIGYLVLFATIATIYLYQRATVDLGPGKVMAYGYLNPGIVAFLQLLFDGEQIRPIIWPGILASVAATLILVIDPTPEGKVTP